MILNPGSRLASYEIVSFLGAGGMGEVYKAKDLKLGRNVAIKVLRRELAGDPERLKKFEEEARAASALDHPNIVTIFDIAEADGLHFIVMQYVDGRTLRELIARGRLDLPKVLHYGVQIADALSEAHSKGIVHRDIKTDNAMVTEHGLIIIVDFGLAMLMEPADWSEATTRDMGKPYVREGLIEGTAPYMSPEQAHGKEVDARSDIFSFGSVLYEMVTGRRAFTGDSLASLLASIIRDEPMRVSEIVPDVPHLLERLITRALRKEPERRYQSMADIKLELLEIQEEEHSGRIVSVSQELGPRARRRGRKRWWVAGAAIAVALAVAVGAYLLRPAEETALRLTNPIQVTTNIAVEDFPSWAPDGLTVAYQSEQGGDWDIWAQQIGSAQVVNRTEDYSGADRFPSWSPDGRQIAFLSDRDGGGVYVMPALGGIARKVAAPLSAAAYLSAPQWSADGRELAFATADETGPVVEIFPFDTSESRKLALPASPGNVCLDLSWSPDGRYFAYVDTFGDRTAEVTQIWVLRVADQESFPLTDGRMNDWSPSWSPDGRAVYFVSNRGGGRDLWVQPVGEDGQPAGEPQRLTTGVGMQQAAFSPDGRRLIYSRGGQQVNVWRVPILADRPATWADAEQITFEQAFIQFLDVSRDGQWLIFSSDRSGNQDLWKMPVGGGEFQHLTVNPTPDWHPRLSPDGERLAFYSYRSGNRDIWLKSAEGGPAVQLTDDPSRDVNAAWSPDGRTLAFTSLRSGNEDIWLVPAEGGEPKQLTDDPATDRNAEWSPDGRWVYFVSTCSGDSRLWRVSPEGGEAEPVTARSATVARASADGKYIYYLGPGRNIYAVSLEDGTEVAVTDLQGRPGARSIGLAVDSKYLYFNWGSNVMDLWVMDVVRE